MTTALLGLQLLAGAASAGNTRVLYVGDPEGFSRDTTLWADPFYVSPTVVSAGNVSYFDVLIFNNGKQNLTKATIGGGDLMALDNGVLKHQLPSDWTIKGVSPSTGCTFNGPDGAYTGFSCSAGSLAKLTGYQVRVYLNAGSAAPLYPGAGDADAGVVAVSGQVAENVGGNVGSNSNTFFAFATDTAFWSPATTGYIAGLFPADRVEPTHGALKTYVDLTSVGSDTLVQIDENQSGPSCDGIGYVCIPANAAFANVNDGQPVTPYFTWNVQFPVDSTFKLTNKTGIIHWFTDGSYEVFFNVKKTSCSTGKVPCADFTLDTSNAAQWYLVVNFHTSKNGYIKGFG